MSGLFTRGRVIVAVVVAVAAVAVGGTALALTTSAASHVVSMSTAGRTGAALLRGGKVGGIAVTAGSDILDVSLPKPAGTLPFLLAGGASQFLLSLPGGVPAQVTVGGGASLVSVDNQNLTGVAGGTVLTPPGWAAATSRFDIDATSGFSRLTVSRWSAAGS
jgi:hypothetical protein